MKYIKRYKNKYIKTLSDKLLIIKLTIAIINFIKFTNPGLKCFYTSEKLYKKTYIKTKPQAPFFNDTLFLLEKNLNKNAIDIIFYFEIVDRNVFDFFLSISNENEYGNTWFRLYENNIPDFIKNLTETNYKKYLLEIKANKFNL